MEYSGTNYLHRKEATLRIVFGWHLDGPTFPETTDRGAFCINAAVVGPLGLLDILETILGCNGPVIPPAVRIAQYLSRLKAIDDGKRFYSSSLTADNWATSRLLLGWRDELVAEGWTPDSLSWNSIRLQIFASAELTDMEPLGLGVPDRLRELIPRIQGSKVIEELVLVDESVHLPFVWRQLLKALENAGTRIDRVPPRSVANGTDLATVQELLSTGTPGRLTGDNTIVIARCDHELIAADIATEWLAAAQNDNHNVVIVRQGNANILDTACRRLGLPRPGGSERSPYRGVLQVLPLAFETAWQPLDAARVLELLVMRESPISYRSGWRLADVLRDFPGTGGARWREAWEIMAQELRDAASGTDGDPEEQEQAIQKRLTQYRDWLEPRRFDRAAGITAHAATETCGRVQQWAIRRGSSSPDGVYVQTASAAAALAETIAASGIDPIPKVQLDRMMDAVIAEGISKPGTTAEAAAWSTVNNSEQVWDSVHSVLWWGFVNSGTGAYRRPWTRAEQGELATSGVEFRPAETSIAFHLDAQRRAILNATKRALLIMPAPASKENTGPHPLWHAIASLKDVDTAVIEGRLLRGTSKVALCGRAWDTTVVQQTKLPQPIRDWTTSENRILAPAGESATSLEGLLGCPLHWVLRYVSRLRESGILDMADGNRLKGNVAHEVLAQYFAETRPDSEKDIRQSVGHLLDRMLPEIGSPLLLPGRLRDLEDLRRSTIESAVALQGMLSTLDLTVTATERQIELPLDSRTTLSGLIDVELAAADGQLALVDLKWSKWDQYRREEIAQGRPIQLATYSHLLRHGGEDSYPPGGYFMIKQRRLLAVDSELFPEEFRIPGPNLQEVWAAVLDAREKTFETLASGKVVATGVDADHAVPVIASDAEGSLVVEPPCQFCAYGRLCGKRVLS